MGAPILMSMLAIAILRTLLVTLCLMVPSPWQATGADAGAQPDRVATSVCLGASCAHPGGWLAHPAEAPADMAISLVSPGDTSPDDGCEPSRPRDRSLADGREAPGGAPTWPMQGWTGPGGLERPPKATVRRPT